MSDPARPRLVAFGVMVAVMPPARDSERSRPVELVRSGVTHLDGREVQWSYTLESEMPEWLWERLEHARFSIQKRRADSDELEITIVAADPPADRAAGASE